MMEKKALLVRTCLEVRELPERRDLWEPRDNLVPMVMMLLMEPRVIRDLRESLVPLERLA